MNQFEQLVELEPCSQCGTVAVCYPIPLDQGMYCFACWHPLIKERFVWTEFAVKGADTTPMDWETSNEDALRRIKP